MNECVGGYVFQISRISTRSEHRGRVWYCGSLVMEADKEGLTPSSDNRIPVSPLGILPFILSVSDISNDS